MHRELVIIGGGSAGLAAACAAHDAGVRDILIIEREAMLGGILQQCIHNGFGLHIFDEELTGPEYSQRYIDRVQQRGIECWLGACVLSLNRERSMEIAHAEKGYIALHADAIILATGCRERPRGAIQLPGTRPSGIFTAGTAQKYINMEGRIPGNRFVILGSGDIGLIMARRIAITGGTVEAVVEYQPYPGGLTRNVVQCLDDFGIPLLLEHTATEVHGKKRLTGITIAKLNRDKKTIAQTAQYIACDTLLLSVGLIPEMELAEMAGIALHAHTLGAVVDNTMQTDIPGIFCSGNCLHVHDLVDNVSRESAIAGRSAARYLRGTLREGRKIPVIAGDGIRGVTPQYIRKDTKADTMIYFRPGARFQRRSIGVYAGEERLQRISRPVFLPSEMLSITLKPDEVFKSDDIYIKIED